MHAPQNQDIIVANAQEHKDNLFTRGWTRIDQCHFRGHAETLKHLLF